MICLMRHGADSTDRLGGWSEYGLTEEGRRQVRESMKQLLGKGIEEVYASDLPRARETAEIAAAYLQLPVAFLPRFRETNNGLLAGMLKTEAKEKYPGLYWSALDWTRAYPGGESPEAFFARIAEAWPAFKADVRGKTVLLVTHGGVINSILCLENGIAYSNKEVRYPVGYAEIVRIP